MSEADAMNGQCIQGQEFCLERGLLPVPLVSDERITVDTMYRPGRRRA